MSADDFLKFSKALKDAGRKDLRRELHKGLQDAAKELIPEAQKVLSEALPSRLAARGARTKQVAQVKTGKDPGITIGVRFGRRGAGLGASNARMLNAQGKIRHPTWGDRERWVNTDVPAGEGWFDETYRRGAPRVRPALDAAVDRVIDKIVREAG